MYGEEGVGYGNHFSFKLGLNIVSPNGQLMSLCYYRNSREAPGAPDDYHAGLLSGLPKQRTNLVSFMYGKVFYAKNSRLRYTLKAGPAIGDAATPTNYTQTGGAIWDVGPNYNYTYHTVFNYGVIFNPAVELPLSNGFGFSLGAFTVLSGISSSAGIEANMIMGNLRNRHAQ